MKLRVFKCAPACAIFIISTPMAVEEGGGKLTSSKDFVFNPNPQRGFLIEAGVKF